MNQYALIQRNIPKYIDKAFRFDFAAFEISTLKWKVLQFRWK